MSNRSAALSEGDLQKIVTELSGFLPKQSQLTFDPLHRFHDFAVLVVAVFSLVLLGSYWRTVLSWFSEDRVLRCDRFCAQYWVFLQCCGLCDGEWTRPLSSLCCICCPSLRGRNLKRSFGEWLGLSPLPIRVQNITLGGLPTGSSTFFRPKSPDLYVQVLADELQPTLNTEVVTQANSGCVQFTAGLTLMLKNNIKEDSVHFCAKELRLVGSRDIADCYISPTRLISWAQKNKKVRIQLRPLTGQRVGAPWLLLDLSIPPEIHFLRTSVGAFNPIISDELVEAEASAVEEITHTIPRSEGVGNTCMTSCTPRAEPRPLFLLPTRSSRGYKMFQNPNRFVREYPLVSETGAQVKESEDVLGSESMRFRGYVRASLCLMVCGALICSMAYFVAATCYEEHRQLQVVWQCSQRRSRSSGNSYSDFELDYARFTQLCHFEKFDIHKFAGHIVRSPVWNRVEPRFESCCDANSSLILDFCKQPPSDLVYQPKVFELVPCSPMSCKLYDFVNGKEATIFVIFALWGVAVAIGRKLINNHIRQALERPTRENIAEMFEYLAAREPSGRKLDRQMKL